MLKLCLYAIVLAFRQTA